MTKISSLIYNFFFFFVLTLIVLPSCYYNIDYKMQPPKSKVTYNHIITKKIIIDEEFTKEEKDLIIKSTQDWEKFTNNLVNFKIIKSFDLKQYDENVLVIYKDLSSNISVEDETVAFYSSKIISYICVLEDRGSINIIGKDKFYKMVLHELGHALNIKHIEAYAIMNPVLEDQPMCLTKYDAMAFCTMHGCNHKNLKFCQ